MTKKDLLLMVKQSGKPRMDIWNNKIHYWEKDRFTVYVSWGRDYKIPDAIGKRYYQSQWSIHKGALEAKTFFTMAKAKALKAKLEGWIND